MSMDKRRKLRSLARPQLALNEPKKHFASSLTRDVRVEYARFALGSMQELALCSSCGAGCCLEKEHRELNLWRVLPLFSRGSFPSGC